jgi:hypothetical protein
MAEHVLDHGCSCAACTDEFYLARQQPSTDKERSAQMGNGTPFLSAVGTDNWVHRSKGMSCSTCMWYVPKVSLQPPFKVGRCRKHSPTLGGWPVMVHSDWCGDHKLDEEKA